MIQIKPPLISAFYERRRRLAYAFGAACLFLLTAQGYLGFSAEVYDDPRATAGADGFRVAHQLAAPGDESGPGTRLLFLDAALGIRNQLTLTGDARGVLVEGEDVTTFFGKGATVHRGGNSVRHFELGQTWDVLSAVLDAPRDQAWIFGWHDGNLVARRRIQGAWSAEIPVHKSGRIDGMSTMMDGEKGPIVAWSAAGQPIVKTAVFDGRSFVPRAEFDLGPVNYWEVVATRGRLLAVSHRREDRTFGSVTFHLQCCKECGLPPPPERIGFGDPVVGLGRLVTGMTATASREHLVVFLTRMNTLQAAQAPLETFLPLPGASLASIAADSPWKRAVGMFWLPALLFCAVALVSLGLVMLRERGRAALSRIQPPAPGPAVADVLPRLFAHVLDSLILGSIVFPVADLLSWLPDWRFVDRFDPNMGKFTALVAAFLVAYYAPMEALLGGTPGKKILGLRVIGAEGSRPSVLGILLRTLLRPIDTFPLVPVGLVLIMSTRRRQRLGDLLGRTVVIQDRPPEKSVRKGEPEREESR